VDPVPTQTALGAIDYLWRLAVTLFFVAANGFFVAAEFALVKVRPAAARPGRPRTSADIWTITSPPASSASPSRA
jgi:CBS domain containing-hemolysin-like protein